jgi:hypothetical protein
MIMNRVFFQLDDMFYNISTVVFKFVLLSHVTENQSLGVAYNDK